MSFQNQLLALITDFLKYIISAAVFSDEFIALYKRDEEFVEEPYGRFFSAVFAACDAYCEDQNLRDEYDLDEQQLFVRVRELYEGFSARRQSGRSES